MLPGQRVPINGFSSSGALRAAPVCALIARIERYKSVRSREAILTRWLQVQRAEATIQCATRDGFARAGARRLPCEVYSLWLSDGQPRTSRVGPVQVRRSVQARPWSSLARPPLASPGLASGAASRSLARSQLQRARARALKSLRARRTLPAAARSFT